MKCSKIWRYFLGTLPFLFLSFFYVNADEPPVFQASSQDEDFRAMKTPLLKLHIIRQAQPDKLTNTAAYGIDRTISIGFGAPLQAPVSLHPSKGKPGVFEAPTTENQLAPDPDMMVREVPGTSVYVESDLLAPGERDVDCRLVAVNMIMANIDYEVKAQKNRGQEVDPFNVQTVKKWDNASKTYQDFRESIDPRESASRLGGPESMVWNKRVFSIERTVAASLFKRIKIQKSRTPDNATFSYSGPEIIQNADGKEERAGFGEIVIEFKPPESGKKFAFDESLCKSLNKDLCELSFQINACGLRYIQKSSAAYNAEKCTENSCHRGLSDWIKAWLPGEMIFARNGTTVSSIKEARAQAAGAHAASVRGAEAPHGGFRVAVPVFRDDLK